VTILNNPLLDKAATPSGLPYPVSTAPLNQGANDIKALALAIDPRLTLLEGKGFVKAGRVDRVIEGNGYLRLTVAESFFDWSAQGGGMLKPTAIVSVGIDQRFGLSTWDGAADGAGCLMQVWQLNGTKYGAGNTVAVYYACFK